MYFQYPPTFDREEMFESNRWKILLAYHVGGGAERLVEQTFDGQPLDGTILIVPEAMIILREQVPGQGVVRDLNSQIVVNAAREKKMEKMMES